MKTTKLPKCHNPLTYTILYQSTRPSEDVYLKPKRINLINYNHVLLDLKMLQLGKRRRQRRKKEELTTSLAHKHRQARCGSVFCFKKSMWH